MKTHLECVPCFINQSLEAARLATDDEEIHEKVLKEVMKHLQNVSFQNSPPELSLKVHQIIRRITKIKDPYKKVKIQSNETAKNLYPHLKKLVKETDDPLLMAIKLAIVGNVIDFGTSNRFTIDDTLEVAVKKRFSDEAYPKFKNTLNKATTILYIADNSGEIFFDKLLLEELANRGKKIIYVVKANPIINDVLIEDAEFASIDKLARIIQGDAGRNISAPGILLKNASDEFLKYFNSADMVISKGQGNYESLSSCKREVFFLLMIKCPLVAEDIGLELASLVLKVKT
jgi:uncharacterized protein with ATP-grasp and redox domains